MSREWWLDDLRFYGLSKVVQYLPPARIKRGTVDSEGQRLTSQLGVSEVLGHVKREFKPRAYCNTVTNHSFHYSRFRVSQIFIRKSRKSNVQADLYCLHTTERPFSCHAIYICMQVSKGAPSRHTPWKL